jgi:predicted nucleic acid-binding protein
MILTLDAKRRLTLPASLVSAILSPRRRARHHLARKVSTPVLHEFNRHRAIGILGADQAWKQRVALQNWLTELLEAMHGRILEFSVSVAHVWADQQYHLQAAGKPMPVEDSYIAAVARRNNLTIATGNVKDFQRPGIKAFDPCATEDRDAR